MNYENLDEDVAIKLQKKLDEERNYVFSLNTEEFLDRILEIHNSTDVILEGVDLADEINAGQGISIAGLIRLRNGLIECAEWINHKMIENNSEEEL